MENLDSIKERIVDAMVEYYGTEYQDKINDIVNNTPLYEYNRGEASSIKKNENYIAKGYHDYYYLLIDKQFYEWVATAPREINPEYHQFIAINKGFINTPAKEIYALTKAYIMAMMSKNTFTKNNNIYSSRRGFIYSNYNMDEFENYDQESSTIFFEDACTMYDACNITKNILKTNDEDFCFDDIYNMRSYVALLLDNKTVRNTINYGRINHDLVTNLGIDEVVEVQRVLNDVVPEIIIKVYNNKEREELLEEQYNYLLPIKETLDKKSKEDKKQK